MCWLLSNSICPTKINTKKKFFFVFSSYLLGINYSSFYSLLFCRRRRIRKKRKEKKRSSSIISFSHTLSSRLFWMGNACSLNHCFKSSGRSSQESEESTQFKTMANPAIISASDKHTATVNNLFSIRLNIFEFFRLYFYMVLVMWGMKVNYHRWKYVCF